MSNQGPRRNGPVKLRLTGEEGFAGLPGAHVAGPAEGAARPGSVGVGGKEATGGVGEGDGVDGAPRPGNASLGV